LGSEDVSFELEPGQSLGYRSQWSRQNDHPQILSGYEITSGELEYRGRLSALIELGAGFHPELSGRENIFLNGTILGMSRSEINARFDEIVEFAGIGHYLDTPVKRYSSGMHARLGFAIAAHVNPEILLVDEVLAVGDHSFQMKCYKKMEELRTGGTTLIFVSHNLAAVRKVCLSGLVMYRGRCIFNGSASEAIVAYSDAIREAQGTIHYDAR
jgi:lipopolysaccharide transport system ATP-binding protein